MKKKQPLVSIIIPTFNRKTYLYEAIESCRSQTYWNLEIIVVDDGSTDGTEDFIFSQIKSEWKADNIHVLKQINAGASRARNKGLEFASGDFVQFLDSDDLLHPEKITLQVEKILNSRDLSLSVCNCYGLMGPLGEDRNEIAETRIGVYKGTPYEYTEVLLSRIVHGMQTSAPLWRKSFLDRNDGWREDISLGDDLEYHIRLLTNTSSIEFVSKELFWVRDHLGERLSDFKYDETKLFSSLKTYISIHETLVRKDLWTEQHQKNLLSAVRTLYYNFLANNITNEEIIKFEVFAKVLSRKPRRFYFLPILFFLRKHLGRKLIVNTYNNYRKFIRN